MLFKKKKKLKWLLKKNSDSALHSRWIRFKNKVLIMIINYDTWNVKLPKRTITMYEKMVMSHVSYSYSRVHFCFGEHFACFLSLPPLLKIFLQILWCFPFWFLRLSRASKKKTCSSISNKVLPIFLACEILFFPVLLGKFCGLACDIVEHLPCNWLLRKWCERKEHPELKV